MTPKVPKEEKNKKPTGRAAMRKKYNKRIKATTNNMYSVNSPFNQAMRRECKERDLPSTQKKAKTNSKKNKKSKKPSPKNDQVSGFLSKKFSWKSIKMGDIIAGSTYIPKELRPKTVEDRYYWGWDVRTHWQETNRIASNEIRLEMRQKMIMRTFETDDIQFCDMFYVLFSDRFIMLDWQIGKKYFEDFTEFRGMEGWKGGILSIIKKRIPRKTLSHWNIKAQKLCGPMTSPSFHLFLSILDQETST
eukprot:TRINITY_DN19636_c0_g1_i1.p1 TRINITY_DN19636_c0_g1~~TRINITY_DN19636_c0_g1_i1.p1  ORF type:complete len:264 (+),score=87.36 TRINITY_DN19636_c0_g1_i1:52-792(+)